MITSSETITFFVLTVAEIFDIVSVLVVLSLLLLLLLLLSCCC
jgi:nitrate reductase NapE component